MTRLASEDQVVEFVRAAREQARPFEIAAGGTRRTIGKPMGNLPVADVSGLTGIVKYEPEELILTVRPGTTLSEINAALAAKNQCLGFDPISWGFLGQKGDSTIGGAVSADSSGSGRLRHGAARDSLLGFRGINGFGESFRAGSKVVKNVTGFDLPKLVCGAFGTLCVLTELTFRVYPKAKFSATIAMKGLAPEAGFAALRTIWHSALEPTGLAYVPDDMQSGTALIRFEAAEQPLREKCAAAKILLGAGEEGGDDVFAGLGAGAAFAMSDLDVWRILVPPSEASRTAAALASPLWYGDWAGGLLWAGMRGEDAERVRAIAAGAGGHAMLLRAPAERRAALGLFAPQPAPLAALSARVKAAFDPLNLFNPGRF